MYRGRGRAEALSVGRSLAGGGDVRIGGGTTTVRAFLQAGLIDEAHIVVVPVLLGRGERPWDGPEGLWERSVIEQGVSPTGAGHPPRTRRRGLGVGLVRCPRVSAARRRSRASPGASARVLRWGWSKSRYPTRPRRFGRARPPEPTCWRAAPLPSGVASWMRT